MNEAERSPESGNPGEAPIENGTPTAPRVPIDWGTFPLGSEFTTTSFQVGASLEASATGYDPSDVAAVAMISRLRGVAGVHLAPGIETSIAESVCTSYLSLGPDELLLAVVAGSSGLAPASGCSLTSRRLCWYDQELAAEAGLADSPNGIAGGVSLDYARIPDTIRVGDHRSAPIELAEGWILPTRGLDRAGKSALVEVLRKLSRAATTGELASSSSAETMEQARLDLPRITAQSSTVRRLRHDHRSFYDLARMAAPRVVVTPVLVTVCVLVWILMVVRAGTAADPNAPSLFNWGGNSGVSVFLGREYWRLLTGTFLHAGILHLAFNMWCLGRLGPLIERLYGYVGFALLYIASGIGGSLASAWWHPLVVGVGASGAIFGILGGLLAFLLVHRHGIPPSVFHSLRSAVVFFVGFNVLNGLAADQIDNAAHLGGLAGGLVAGILLSRPWPSRGPFDGLVRQLLRMIPIALLLGVVSLLVADRVRKSPEVLQLVQSYDAPRVAYNSLMKSLEPRLIQFDSLNRELNEFLQHASQSSSQDPAQLAILDRMLAELARSQNLVSAVSTTDPDLRQATDSFQAAQGRLGQALRSLRAALAEEDVSHLDGPEGYKASMTQLKADIESFHAECRKYLQDHELVAVPEAP